MPNKSLHYIADRPSRPEWLIMFIAILSVKLKIKTYVQIHKMAVKYWDFIAKGLNLTPISERQLREMKLKSGRTAATPWKSSKN